VTVRPYARYVTSRVGSPREDHGQEKKPRACHRGFVAWSGTRGLGGNRLTRPQYAAMGKGPVITSA
jgi:hypothetical protein